MDNRVFEWGYDTLDRMRTATYPAANGLTETLTYTYDVANRQVSVCSNQYSAICYAKSATYTPLDQPALT